jgi:hypothetical protein
LFSAGREDSPALVAKIIEDNKRLTRRVSELEEVASRVEAEDLLKEAGAASGSERGSSPTVREGARRYGTGSGPGSPSGQPGGGGDRVSSPTVNEASRLAAGYRPPALESERARGLIVVAKIFNDRNADSLKHLALALIAHPNTVALLGSRDGETARLVFARSSDAAGDMNVLMRKACEVIDGRGGGKPDMAQGGGKNVAALDKAVQATAQGLIES